MSVEEKIRKITRSNYNGHVYAKLCGWKRGETGGLYVHEEEIIKIRVRYHDDDNIHIDLCEGDYVRYDGMKSFDLGLCDAFTPVFMTKPTDSKNEFNMYWIDDIFKIE